MSFKDYHYFIKLILYLRKYLFFLKKTVTFRSIDNLSLFETTIVKHQDIADALRILQWRIKINN